MEVDLEHLRKPCTCGRAHEISVRGVWIESGATGRLYEMMTEGELREFTLPVIVWDDNTCEAAEEIMEDVEGICQEICLSAKDLRADSRSVEILEETLPEETDLILAVGSGTIHDLCRYVSFQRRIPFLSVPTAASADGFASVNAAMVLDGRKQTVPAQAPLYVFADTDIFAKAPYRLTASGISDLLGKYVCLADWRAAHAVTGEYICEEICSLEYRALKDVAKRLDDIRDGDGDACERLMYALLLPGLAMQMTRNSRPAFCAEHDLARLWEMEVISGHTDALHGERVGVALLLAEEYYHAIQTAIEEGRCRVRPYQEAEKTLQEKISASYGLHEALQDRHAADFMEKVDPERLRRALPEIAGILDDLPSGQKLRDMMKEGGCRISFADIGLPESIGEESLALAACVGTQTSLLRIAQMLEL